jgi:predicted nucleic acid-binding protein
VIVIDASALTELLLQTELGSRVEARLFRGADDLHTPHLLDVEIVRALRRLVRAGHLAAHGPRRRSTTRPISMSAATLTQTSSVEAWELRDNLTAYDAIYVALAGPRRAVGQPNGRNGSAII